MLLSNRPRTVYANAPAHEVICQLRFPTILTINSTEPAALQEAIRADFPQYAHRQDVAPPQISGLGGPTPQIKQLPPVSNYHFLSADGLWKVNLTQNFLALSTLRYTGWEDFSRLLDKALASFIRIYQPAHFERVGLRYVNIISRQKLGLTGTPWHQLLAPAYTGPLAEPELAGDGLLNCAVDLQFKLDSSCQAKIHAAPGRMRVNRPDAQPDPEVKFILDMDLAMAGQTACPLAAGALETLHAHANSLFEGALTDTLRDAIR